MNKPKIVKEKVEPDMRLIPLEKEHKGFLDFDRFRERADFFKMQGTIPHDQRFVSYDYFPRVYSKTKYLLKN